MLICEVNTVGLTTILFCEDTMSKPLFLLVMMATLPLLAQDCGTWDVKIALGGADMTKGWRNPEAQPAIQLGLERLKGTRLLVVDLFYTNPDDSDTVPLRLDDGTQVATDYDYEVEEVALTVGYGLKIDHFHFLGRTGLASYSEKIDLVRSNTHYHADADSFGLQLGLELGYQFYRNFDVSFRANRLLAGNSKVSENDPEIKFTKNTFSTLAIMVGYTF